MAINLTTTVASGDTLDVRHFMVTERISSLFRIELDVLCKNPSIELDAVIGRPASFMLDSGLPGPKNGVRNWHGICADIQLVAVAPAGLSSYRLSIVPTLWLATQRRNYRMFQQMSEPDMVLKLLSEWGLSPDVRIDAGAYKTRKYRVQYGESDYAFMSRMLEYSGISFLFEQQGDNTQLVLTDAPQGGAKRQPLPFIDSPSSGTIEEYVTKVNIVRRVRPGHYTKRDHDYRRSPSFPLIESAQAGESIEQKLERFHYTPGAFLFGAPGGDTPVADDRGASRHQLLEGARMVASRLAAKRASAKVISFATTAHDLGPGTVMSLLDHPHGDVADGKPLLVLSSTLTGEVNDEWYHDVEAVNALQAYAPPLETAKPVVNGVESATVVGPPGEEIHTDEFGRVRVHFHWDQESGMDEKSSCWIHVSQSWAGSGYGWVTLPRVGQEVLVDFLSGDPDRPIIVGRVYTGLQKVPYALPENKTKSGWKSMSSPGGGGYNEIMMEDAAGNELLNIQAQKNLTKLVKNNESAAIINNRSHRVGVNESLSVGSNRSHSVGANESITVGVNQSATVGVNQSLSIGVDQTLMVGANQTNTIGGDQTNTINGDQTNTVCLNQTTQVGVDQALDVGGAQTANIGADQALEVGGAQTIAVGADQASRIGAAQSLVVGGDQTVVIIAGDQTIAVNGGARVLTVSSSITTNAGADISTTSSGGAISMAAPNGVLATSTSLFSASAPTITISGNDVTITGNANVSVVGGNVLVDGSAVTVQATGNVDVTGAVIKLN